MDAPWPQVYLTWANWAEADIAAARHLRPWLINPDTTHIVGRWHYLRKRPAWRLRYDTRHSEARTCIDDALGTLQDRGVLTTWAHGIYEPESLAFGGTKAMQVAHDLFVTDSYYCLAYLAAHTQEPDDDRPRVQESETAELPPRELGVLLAATLLRGTGLDWFEQGEVWARVARERTTPAAGAAPPPSPGLCAKMRTLLMTGVAAVTRRNLVPTAWADAYTVAGSRLADLAVDGTLHRGLRAVLAHHVIFAWNRLGLSSHDQQRLTTIAKEVVMNDHGNRDTRTVEAPAGAELDQTATKLRDELVDQLRAQGVLTSAAREQAMRKLPRHLFVPGAALDEAYGDHPVHIKHAAGGASLSCASQPSIVAMMLDQIHVQPGHRVLELGTGSGYNAALLANLAGEHGHVTTVDIDADLTDNARGRLASAAVDNVNVITGDGAVGHESDAPYDRIIATVGAHTIPAAWHEQLAPDGRLVVPIRIAGDNSRSITFTHDPSHDGGRLVSEESRLCTFMPLRGGIGDDPRRVLDLTGDGAVTLQANNDQSIEPRQVEKVLARPRRDTWTGITFGKGQPLDLMWLWLALNLPNALSRMLASDGGQVTTGLPWGSMASVPTTEPGLAYLALRQIQDQPPLHEVGIISHGDAGHTLADQMVDQLQAWNHHRKQSISVTWYPSHSTPPQASPTRFIARRGHSHLVIAWGEPG